MPILAIVVVVKGRSLLQNILQFLEREQMGGIIVIIAVAAVCLLASMNDMVVPSVSLEGKNLWILQSLPVKPWNILRAKLSMQLLLTGIPVFLCEVCIVVCVRADVVQSLFILILPLIFTVMLTVFGLFLGINMPNLTWTNELAPIKQSLSVVISMFGGWAVAVGMVGLYFACGKKLGEIGYLSLVTLVFVLISAGLYLWLKRKGAEKFIGL